MTPAQLTNTAFVSEPLTWDQICERYPDEWVCLVEIDWIDRYSFSFRTARVVGHGAHPRDPFVQARAIRHRYEDLGHYFTGPSADPAPTAAATDEVVVAPRLDVAALISEPLTWPQICARYPDEWVCLVEIDRPVPQNFAFRTARVIGHGSHPRDPFLQAKAFDDRYDGIGHYFTGRIRRPLPRLFFS